MESRLSESFTASSASGGEESLDAVVAWLLMNEERIDALDHRHWMTVGDFGGSAKLAFANSTLVAGGVLRGIWTVRVPRALRRVQIKLLELDHATESRLLCSGKHNFDSDS